VTAHALGRIVQASDRGTPASVSRVLAILATSLPGLMLTAIALSALAAPADGPADRARAILDDITHAPSRADGGAPAVVAPTIDRAALEAASGAIEKARAALSRATELRRLGDPARAEIAEDLALEWAMTARATIAATSAERTISERRARLSATASSATRTRASLDEAITKRARLRAELEALDRATIARALGPDAGLSNDGGPAGGKDGGKDGAP
jgi:hypothetical protein